MQFGCEKRWADFIKGSAECGMGITREMIALEAKLLGEQLDPSVLFDGESGLPSESW